MSVFFFMELKDALSELSVLASVLPRNKIHSMLWILYADEEIHYRDIVLMITEPVTFRICVFLPVGLRQKSHWR